MSDISYLWVWCGDLNTVWSPKEQRVGVGHRYRLATSNIQYTPQAAYTHSKFRCIKHSPKRRPLVAYLFSQYMPANTMPPLKLLDQLRSKVRVKHYSLGTECQYLHWAKRFIFSIANVTQQIWGCRSGGVFDAGVLHRQQPQGAQALHRRPSGLPRA